MKKTARADVRSAIREGKLHVINIPILQRLVADVEVAVLGGFVDLETAPVDTVLPRLVALYHGVDVCYECRPIFATRRLPGSDGPLG